MPLLISDKIKAKLREKHGVDVQEIFECFANRCGNELTDTREEHASDPPTRWFIACTNRRRRLKVVYVPRADGLHIRTAYEPNEIELSIYRRFGGEID